MQRTRTISKANSRVVAKNGFDLSFPFSRLVFSIDPSSLKTHYISKVLGRYAQQAILRQSSGKRMDPALIFVLRPQTRFISLLALIDRIHRHNALTLIYKRLYLNRLRSGIWNNLTITIL